MSSPKSAFGHLSRTLYLRQILRDIEGASQIFVTRFQNISVNQISDLRKKLRKNKVTYRVVKNSLAKRVLDQVSIHAMTDSISGQCGIGVCDGDVATLTKIFTEFAKDNEGFSLESVYLEGAVFGKDKIEYLASLPSRHELLSQLCGGMQSPMRGLVGVLSGVMRNFVNVLDQIAKKKEK